MGNITSDLNKIGFRKERNAQASYTARYTDSFRVGYGGVQATPVAIPATDCLGWDKPDGELEIPEPLRKKEELNVIGDGPKTADIVEMGYETVEQSFSVNAQTGIWLYYALGGYSCDGTDGVSISTPVTRTSITRTNDTTLTVSAGLGVDTYNAGYSVRFTNGEYKGSTYDITGTTDTTLVIDGTLPTDIATSYQGGSPSIEVVKLITVAVNTITRASVKVLGGFTDLVVDDLIGSIVRITSGTYNGWVFVITDNDATTITLNTCTPADFATSDSGTQAPSVEILEAPFTHSITEPTTTATQVATNSQVYLPSFIIHFEQSDGTNKEYRDLIGCLVKSLKITIEKGAKVMYEVTVLVPKSMVGLVQTTYPTYALCGDTRAALSYPTDEVFGWFDFNLAGSSFTYNSNAIFASTQNWFNELGKLEITISRELSIEPIQGDPYSYKILNGKLDYEVLMTYYPNSNEIAESEGGASTYRLLKSLKRMKLSEYDGNVALVVKLARATNDYVQLTFSSLYVTEYPDKLTTIEEKIVSVDVTLRNAPAKGSVTQGSLAAEVKDDRNPAYYGDT